MARSQSFLTKKYGPLPAWGWAAVGVGGFLAYRYYQANKQAGAGDQSQPGGWSGQPTGAPGGAGGRHRRRHR